MRVYGLLLAITLLGGVMPMVEAAIELDEHQFDVGTEVYYYNYEESNFMEQDGAFFGITSTYEYHNEWVAHLDGRLAFGSLDYTSQGTGTLSDVDNYVFEGRGWLGWDIPVSDTIVVTPFAGLGYRYLNSDSAGQVTTTGHLGYERESQYIYSPIGVTAKAQIDSVWSANLTGEFDIFWDGTQQSNFSEIIGGLNDLENDQEDGYGLRASLDVERKGETFDVIINTFVRYWNIDESNLAPINFMGNTVALGFEPQNETVEAGGGVTLRF